MVNGRGDFGRLAAWRSAIVEVLRYESRCWPITGAVEAEMLFLFAKPKRPKYGWPVSGDIDKLVRAILDAATGIAFSDDTHVTRLIASKSWTTGREGVWVAFRAAVVTIGRGYCTHSQGWGSPRWGCACGWPLARQGASLRPVRP